MVLLPQRGIIRSYSINTCEIIVIIVIINIKSCKIDSRFYWVGKTPKNVLVYEQQLCIPFFFF